MIDTPYVDALVGVLRESEPVLGPDTNFVSDGGTIVIDGRWDTAELEQLLADAFGDPVAEAVIAALRERGNEAAAVWVQENEDEAWGQHFGPMLDDIEGRIQHG